MFRKASNSVWKSTVVVPPDPLPLTPSASSSPENTDKVYDDPAPADEGDLQMEYSSYSLYTPSMGSVTLPIRT